MYLRFLSLNVFNPKLDHPDANVINCINKSPRGRKHVKYICEYQIRSTSFIFFFEAVLTISFLKLFNPKLDHPDANVINCIYKRVHWNPWGRMLNTHVSIKLKVLYFILLWSYIYDFAFSSCIWSKTGSPRCQCNHVTIIQCYL